MPSSTIEELYAVTNMTEKQVRPSLARRLAMAAALTCTLMGPVREMIGAVSPQVDIMEIACSPNSTLTATFQDHGYTGLRVNYLTGFNLDAKHGTAKLATTIAETKPRLTWVSMSCTRLSALQNLTPRTPEEMDRFLHRRGQDLRRNDEVVQSLEPVLESGDDIAWEWPTTATAGWKSEAIARLHRLAAKHNRRLHWTRIDGCAYGLQWQDDSDHKSGTLAFLEQEM